METMEILGEVRTGLITYTKKKKKKKKKKEGEEEAVFAKHLPVLDQYYS